MFERQILWIISIKKGAGIQFKSVENLFSEMIALTSLNIVNTLISI